MKTSNEQVNRMNITDVMIISNKKTLREKTDNIIIMKQKPIPRNKYMTLYRDSKALIYASAMNFRTCESARNKVKNK